MDVFVYPALRKRGIRFTPIKKITAGFILGSFAMVWAAVLQYYVYKTSGFYADPSTLTTSHPSTSGPSLVSMSSSPFPRSSPR